MAAGKRTSVPSYRGLWVRERAKDKVYELKVDGLSASYPIGFPLSQEAPPREVVTWWKEKTLQKERTGLGLPTPKKLDELATEAFARLDRRIAEGGKKAPSKRTVALYRFDYERYVQPMFGQTYAHKISHSDVLDWLGWLRNQEGRGGRKLASWTVNGKLTVLRHLLKYGRQIGAVDFNVFERIDSADLPAQEAREEFESRALSIAELNRLIDSAKQNTDHTLVIVLGFTGMRRAECAGLLWSDLDLLIDQQIKLTRQLAPLVDGASERVALKNKWSRDVILLDRPREALVEHLAREQAKGRGGLDDLVFTDDDGEPYNLAWFSDAVQRVGTEAGLGRVSPQVLRRTTATIWAYAEIPIHVAANMLGHSIEVFAEHYVQVYKDAQARKDMREALSKVEGYDKTKGATERSRPSS